MVTHKLDNSPLYAIIDLGSNSFHMMITRQLADSVQVVDKVKRKVRLASGLNTQNILSEDAIARGLECLRFFAERLQNIPPENVRIVATATLRIAKNNQAFLQKANQILGQNIVLLSGEQEAELIYLGAAHTSCNKEKRLVIDIGGASTELIIGSDKQPQKITSVDIGCVTYIKQYFTDGSLSNVNFTNAIGAAKAVLKPLVKPYKTLGWKSVLGGSGTMQALAEMLMHQHKPTIITKAFLQETQEHLITCNTIEKIKLPGLSRERSPVIASGIAILIAIYESFDLEAIQLSNGALREGLLYEMLPTINHVNIRQRTINSLMQRYHVDKHHADNVRRQAKALFNSFSNTWSLKKNNAYYLLLASCDLHEIGLLLAFKQHQKHSAYIIEHAELPGFDQADRQLLQVLVLMYKGDIDVSLLQQSATSSETAKYLLIILRLAVILCRLRKDDTLPTFHSSIAGEVINLCLPEDWLEKHPLMADELMSEQQYLSEFKLQLNIQCNIEI